MDTSLQQKAGEKCGITPEGRVDMDLKALELIPSW